LWTIALPGPVRAGVRGDELAMEESRLTGSVQLPAKATSQGLAGTVSIQCNNVHCPENLLKPIQAGKQQRTSIAGITWKFSFCAEVSFNATATIFTIIIQT